MRTQARSAFATTLFAGSLLCVVIPACALHAQIPRASDPFLIMDRIREPIPQFLDPQSPLSALEPPLSFSLEGALGGMNRWRSDLGPRDDALVTLRGHLAPSRPRLVNWDLAGSVGAATEDTRVALVQSSVFFGEDAAPNSLLALYAGASAINRRTRQYSLAQSRDAWLGTSITTPGVSIPYPHFRVRVIGSAQVETPLGDAAVAGIREGARGHFAVSVPLFFSKMSVPGVLYSYERVGPSNVRAGETRHEAALLIDPRTVDQASRRWWNGHRVPVILLQVLAAHIPPVARTVEVRLTLSTLLMASKARDVTSGNH